MSYPEFHLEVPNPDNADEMPIMDSWVHIGNFVANVTERLMPGEYYATMTFPTNDVDEVVPGILVVTYTDASFRPF